MQTTRKAVRYYIDREADAPIIRSVPVSRPTTTKTPRASEPDAATARRRRDARHRFTSMVQARVRKYRHQAS